MDDNEEETFLQVSADLTFVHLIVWNYYANKKKGSNSLVNKCLNLIMLMEQNYKKELLFQSFLFCEGF